MSWLHRRAMSLNLVLVNRLSKNLVNHHHTNRRKEDLTDIRHGDYSKNLKETGQKIAIYFSTVSQLMA